MIVSTKCPTKKGFIHEVVLFEALRLVLSHIEQLG